MRPNSTNILRKMPPVFGSHALKIQQLWGRLTRLYMANQDTFLQ
jgi:hypothetical protein